MVRAYKLLNEGNHACIINVNVINYSILFYLLCSWFLQIS